MNRGGRRPFRGRGNNANNFEGGWNNPRNNGARNEYQRGPQRNAQDRTNRTETGNENNYQRNSPRRNEYQGRRNSQGADNQTGNENNFEDMNYQRNNLHRNEYQGRIRIRRNLQDADNQTGSNNAYRNKNENKTSKMGFKLAEKICDNDDSEELLQALMNDRKGFKELLKDSDLSGDWLVLIIRLLTKVCKSSFIDSKINIFHTVFTHSSYSKQLTRFILDIPNHNDGDKRKNGYFWKDTDKFWNDLLIIFEEVTRMPSFASQNLPTLVKSINRTFPAIQEEHGLHISDDIVGKFDILLKKLQNMKSEYINKCSLVKNEYANQQDDEFFNDNKEPPNDYRQINIYPSIIEVTSREEPFLRRNKVTGSYTGISHYLDVQFRLLREDFIAPLRRGICQYLDDPQRRKYDDVKIHFKVQFLREENENELYCTRIKYDFTNQKRSLKYENSKMFMYGSLVCFTRDRFKNLIFGKIVNREMTLLKRGELIVGFDQHEDILFKTDYIMVESSVYFEPYYQVLTALQRMFEDHFPMERYIIYGEATTNHPNYLHEDTKYTIENYRFYPLQWPNLTAFYGLNNSQQKAFKASLTEEISVIQGPPGTGKTFLGLKIAHTLLKNEHAWYENTPMLVICFTNHALDQFLEGILPCTKKLLRIGGQSKNENLNKYNLRNTKSIKKSATFYQTQRELKVCLSDLKMYDNILSQIKQYNSVVDFSCFHGVVPDFQETWFHHATKQDIINWLLEEVKNTDLTPAGESLWSTKNQTYSTSQSESDNELSSNEDSDDEVWDVDEIYREINISSNFTPLISLQSVMSKITSLENLLREISESRFGAIRLSIEEEKITNELLQLKREYAYLESKLEHIRTTTMEMLNPYKPHHLMTPKQRWALYASWLRQYYISVKNKQEQMSNEYKEKHKLYTDQKCIEDVKAMKENLVIGLTTTGAARLRSSLEALKSPIVIVEEAAEVLEAHIISALTVHCKHLILIGDHKQLKPSTADYKIETTYRLGVSLFERMVNNNLQCYTLNVQHRMKPEICDLIRPGIYSDLRDHESVLERPSIRGIDKCLFFINHDHPEDACHDASKKNIHEAKFLINLAKYLILNGYEPSQITILAAYLGQMFEMQKERKKYNLLLQNVRIAVLDNYQGEESDIILLSLVRNNKEGRIGFLSIENRVCVALSRARNGLYIMGNMQLLSSKSDLWFRINSKLVERHALGTSLALRCHIHNKQTEVQCEEDFANVAEGGCNLMCNAELSCGHLCKSICHQKDRDHNKYVCMELCERRLCDRKEEHICKKRCSDECGPCNYPVTYSLICGHICTLECHVDKYTYKCSELVSTNLSCGHVANKPCHIKAKDFPCPHPCENRLDPCGHACTLKCHVKDDPDHLTYKCTKRCQKMRTGCTNKENAHICTKLCYEECEPCEINVKKKRTVCPHVYIVPCNSNVDDLLCGKPCTKILSCGHKCKNKCCETCGPCKIEVEKIISKCGHKIKIKCSETPEVKHCKQKCNRKLICGHNCDRKCKEECTTKCLGTKTCNLLSPCGHIIKEIKCYERVSHNDPCLLKYCTESCNATLKCQHKCKGTCGACFQGRVHARCGEKCGVFLVCNHECPIPCREACKPCEKKCTYRCIHSVCNRKCGDVCIKCVEPCPRNCVHQRCTNQCGDICSIGPCEKPCPKRLRCGHPCIGFCNDPCPKTCRICDKDELTDIFFGTEDDEDSRFVQLQDCPHVLESTGMENWLNQNEGEIQTKVCPKCKTPIINTQRYGDYVKRAILDIHNIKLKLIGGFVENNVKRSELSRRIAEINAKSSRVSRITVLQDVLRKLQNRLLDTVQQNHRIVRQHINGLVLDSITSKLQILEHMFDMCFTEISEIDISSDIGAQMNFILNCLIRDEDQITVQEVEDLERELDRLKRIVEIFQIKRTFFGTYSRSNLNQIQIIEEQVINLRKYTKAIDADVQDRLKRLNTRVPISDSERIEIVKALGLRKGRWYKCPNGHPYIITECGGAMQVSNCPECGERIGGTSHRVLSTNQFAPEMDDASSPLWPQ